MSIENEVGLLTARSRNALFAIEGFHDPVSEMAKNRGIHDSIVLVVLNKQDCLRR